MSGRTGLTPEAIVTQYYLALDAGDIEALRWMMLPESYRMTLEAYGLKRAFADPAFKALLQQSETDPAARREAEKRVAETLRSAPKTPVIADLRSEPLGKDRRVVLYTEDGSPKKLAFTLTSTGWKIDYYAGRRRG